MVCGGGHVEADKRVSDIEWTWAVAQINDVVNDKLKRLNVGQLTEKESALLSNNVEKAWQRILQG